MSRTPRIASKAKSTSKARNTKRAAASGRASAAKDRADRRASGSFRVFISYKREDQPIADAVKKTLELIAPGRIECFFDLQIKSGTQWANTIREELDKANWFLLIYTGRTDFENCIYEAAYYEISRKNRDQNVSSRPLCCLHDTPELPEALKIYQNCQIILPDRPIEEKSQDGVVIEDRGSEFYKDKPCSRLLHEFIRNCYREWRGQTPRFLENQVSVWAQQISIAFLNASDPPIDEKVRHPRISLEFDKATIDAICGHKLNFVPATIRIQSDSESNALQLLGVNDQTATWGQIRKRFQSEQGGLPDVGWMEEAETAVIAAIRSETIPSIDLGFRMIGDSGGADIYRCVLSRQRIFRSRRQKLYLLFVRTRNRRLANDDAMALLIALQIMTTRFRFEVLKGPWSFQHSTQSKSLEDQSKKFMRLISKAECEATEYGVFDHVLHSAFDEKGLSYLNEISEQWYSDKQKLERTLVKNNSDKDIRVALNGFIKAWLPKNLEFLIMITSRFLDRLKTEQESSKT